VKNGQAGCSYACRTAAVIINHTNSNCTFACRSQNRIRSKLHGAIGCSFIPSTLILSRSLFAGEERVRAARLDGRYNWGRRRAHGGRKTMCHTTHTKHKNAHAPCVYKMYDLFGIVDLRNGFWKMDPLPPCARASRHRPVRRQPGTGANSSVEHFNILYTLNIIQLSTLYKHNPVEHFIYFKHNPVDNKW